MTPFESLVPLLVDEIPRAIAAAKLASPLACLRIVYYDTHAPCTYLRLRTVSAECRTKVLADKGRDAPFYLWAAGEDCGDGQVDLPAEPPATKGQKQIEKLFQEVYELLCDDEDEHMVPFRSMLAQVARALNSKDWAKICPVTDDFVIAIADGDQHFADDYQDLVDSIPAERLELLRARGLLGPGERWDQLPGDEKLSADPGADIEARAQAMPIPERIAYWISELDHLAAGKDCDTSRIGCNAGFPIDHLGEIGSDVVVPLLEFACRWADQLEWTSDDEETAEETPVAEVIMLLLWKVRALGHANEEAEGLLVQFVEKSCRVNKGRALWGTNPYHAAMCLHALFGYPIPEMAGNNALVRPEQFMKRS